MPGQTRAFNDTHSQSIERAINEIAHRLLITLTPCPALTYDDVMDMLSVNNGEFRKLLLNGRSLISVSHTEANDVWIDYRHCARMHISVSGTHAPLLPRDFVLSEDWLENNEKGRLIHKRAMELAALAEDWGLVNHVWDYLNNLMDNEAQVRYVWPSVLALMGNDSDNEKLLTLRDKLLPLKVPRDIPHVPAEMRALIRRASSVVSMSTMLIGMQPEARASSDVNVSLISTYRQCTGGFFSKQLQA